MAPSMQKITLFKEARLPACLLFKVFMLTGQTEKNYLSMHMQQVHGTVSQANIVHEVRYKKVF